MRLRASCLLLVASAAVGCASRAGSPGTESCLESIDAYCAAADPPCVRQVDPTDVAGSFCTPAPPARVFFSVETCTDGSEGVVLDLATGAVLTFVYEADGGLVRVVESTPTDGGHAVACLAGPPSWSGQGVTCTDWNFGYGCGAADAGTD
ncbi:MAG: hypothetical protein ACRELB_05560 [Polyangiaceae bacterium]